MKAIIKEYNNATEIRIRLNNRRIIMVKPLDDDDYGVYFKFLNLTNEAKLYPSNIKEKVGVTELRLSNEAAKAMIYGLAKLYDTDTERRS